MYVCVSDVLSSDWIQTLVGVTPQPLGALIYITDPYIRRYVHNVRSMPVHKLASTWGPIIGC